MNFGLHQARGGPKFFVLWLPSPESVLVLQLYRQCRNFKGQGWRPFFALGQFMYVKAASAIKGAVARGERRLEKLNGD